MEKEKEPSKWWYLVPVFFGIVGGAATYIMFKDSHKQFAKNTVYMGTVTTIFWAIITLTSGI